MFETLRTRHYTRRLASTLAMLLFVQLLLPIQAHARLARSAEGMVVVLCTLQGPRSVPLAPGTPDHTPRTADSAAMLFSDLLNHYTPVISSLPPLDTVLYRTDLWQDSQTLPPWRTSPPPLARGPPSI